MTFTNVCEVTLLLFGALIVLAMAHREFGAADSDVGAEMRHALRGFVFLALGILAAVGAIAVTGNSFAS